MVLAGLAAVSTDSLDKPGHLLCYGIGQAAASLDFYHLASLAYGWANQGFWAGLWPWSTARSDWALDARETWIAINFVCLWKSGTLSPLNTMFSCTLQTWSTKIVLLTSNPHPTTASIHTVNFGSSRPSPWLNLINPGMWYYNRYAYYRRKNLALFSPVREKAGETTYFERLNNYFVK